MNQMLMKIVTILSVVFVLLLFHPLTTQAFTGDSTRFLTLKDTVYLKISPYGGKLLLHTLEAKQTLYSLAKFYQLSLEELYLLNPRLEAEGARIGQVVQIRIPNRAILRYKPTSFDEKKHIPVYHLVEAGQTLYTIAKRYYRMDVEELMHRNQLIDTNLKIGQALRIGWMSVEGIPPLKNLEPDTTKLFSDPFLSMNFQLKNAYEQQLNSGKKEVAHRGLAKVSTRNGLLNGFVVYHEKAALHSVIRIANPMTSKVVYAKVVGRIPPSLEQWDTEVVLVIPPMLGDILGVIDPRFFAKVRYVK